MRDITERIIPYIDKQDLVRRVDSLLAWEQKDDPFPQQFSTNLQFPQGVLLVYPRESSFFCYWPSIELSDLVRRLPPNSEIVQEIIRQGEENLREVLRKTKDELKVRNPKFLNAFTVVGGNGSYNSSSTNTTLEEAAYHVINLKVVTDDVPPTEAEIVRAVRDGMIDYLPSHPQEAKTFFEHAWKMRSALPSVLRAFIDLGDKLAINIYFELFRAAKGEDTFLIDGIQRDVSFNYLGKNLRTKFPEHDFKSHYQDIQDSKLRKQLDELFAKK